MKIPGIFLAALLSISLSGQDSLLSPRFRTVYVLEMSNALDQHLASRLTNSRVLWVVLEPSNADAVLTDSLDDAFWTWMQRTYPVGSPAPGSEAARGRRDNPPGGKQRGTVFLVDPRTRMVLWSTYELPKGASPAELDRTAARITNQLKIAFGRK